MILAYHGIHEIWKLNFSIAEECNIYWHRIQNLKILNWNNTVNMNKNTTQPFSNHKSTTSFCLGVSVPPFPLPGMPWNSPPPLSPWGCTRAFLVGGPNRLVAWKRRTDHFRGHTDGQSWCRPMLRAGLAQKIAGDLRVEVAKKSWETSGYFMIFYGIPRKLGKPHRFKINLYIYFNIFYHMLSVFKRRWSWNWPEFRQALTGPKDSFGHVQLKAVKDFDELPAHSHLCVAGFPPPCHRCFLMLMERVCWNCQCDFGWHWRFAGFLNMPNTFQGCGRTAGRSSSSGGGSGSIHSRWKSKIHPK